MNRCAATELSTRSDVLLLHPFDVEVSNAPAFKPLLNTEARADTWRIIEAFSRSGRPFALDLSWAAGSGSGNKASITIPHAGRVCVFARSLLIRVANLSVDDNRVGVTVADGFAPCQNQWEHTGTVYTKPPVRFGVPPYAHRVRVELGDPVDNPNVTLRLVDGTGVVRSSLTLDNQPERGLLVGGAQTIEVDATVVADFRAVFLLSL